MNNIYEADSFESVDEKDIESMTEAQAKSTLQKLLDKTKAGWSAVVTSDQGQNISQSAQLALELKLGNIAVNSMYTGSMMLAPVPVVEWIQKYPIAEPLFKAVGGAAFSSLLTYGRHQVGPQWKWLVSPLERGCMHSSMTQLTNLISIDALLSKMFSGADAQIVLQELKNANDLAEVNRR